MFRAVREDQKLVFRVKHHELLHAAVPPFQFPPPPVDEDPFDEVLPESRVVQAAVLLDGKQGETSHERSGEDSHPLLHGHAGLRVNLHRGHSGTGGTAFEDKAA